MKRIILSLLLSVAAFGADVSERKTASGGPDIELLEAISTIESGKVKSVTVRVRHVFEFDGMVIAQSENTDTWTRDQLLAGGFVNQAGAIVLNLEAAGPASFKVAASNRILAQLKKKQADDAAAKKAAEDAAKAAAESAASEPK